ncbi:MAG: sigma-54-dependent Fis family transcriptional regulator [Desulfobacterales bacterium]|nr:sigma-54-dependent Fis family transcriptional regulator [Desulfobacterales bacterium]
MEQLTTAALPTISIRQRISVLKLQLEQLSNSWTVDNYWALLKLYEKIIPQLMSAERCTFYIIEMGTEKICSIMGTGLEKQAIIPPKEGSIVGQVISSGQAIIANELEQKAGYHTTVDAQTGFVTRNMICAPINRLTGHGVTGAIQVLNRKSNLPFTSEDMLLLTEIANHLSISIESIRLNKEILRISSQLNREVERVDEGYFKDTPFIAENSSMRAVLKQVQMVASTPVNVCILGENGTGKELIARMIHEKSDRATQPFVAVNCASIPDNLMESEFFGYEKGAFTGADKPRKGYFEQAYGGILFLDEIADMPLSIQPKFLRAIQEGEGYRLGSTKVSNYNFRIISATNKDLKKGVESEKFREDLYFRLFSVEISLPPLRERKEEIVPLAMVFLDVVCKQFNKKVAGFSIDVLKLFELFSWPGNVRQLRKEVERLVALTPAGELIKPETCSPSVLDCMKSISSIELHPSMTLHTLPDQVNALEIRLIQQALEETGNNISKTAKKLGITRQGLYKKLKRYKLFNGI